MRDFVKAIYAIVMVIILIGKLIIFFFGLFFLPYYIWKHYDDQKRRSAEMAFMAKKLGLQFDQARNNRLDRVYRFLRKVKGSRHYALNVMSGKREGYSVKMFEYHYQRYGRCEVWEYSRWIEHNYFSYFVLDLEREFPGLTITEEAPASKLLSRVADAIGFGDIDFESYEFSERFDVRGKNKKFAYDFCNTRMMEYLIDRPIIPIEVEKTSLAIGFDSSLEQAIIKPNLDHLLTLRKLMPDYLFGGNT